MFLEMIEINYTQKQGCVLENKTGSYWVCVHQVLDPNKDEDESGVVVTDEKEEKKVEKDEDEDGNEDGKDEVTKVY